MPRRREIFSARRCCVWPCLARSTGSRRWAWCFSGAGIGSRQRCSVPSSSGLLSSQQPQLLSSAPRRLLGQGLCCPLLLARPSRPRARHARRASTLAPQTRPPPLPSLVSQPSAHDEWRLEPLAVPRRAAHREPRRKPQLSYACAVPSTCREPDRRCCHRSSTIAAVAGVLVRRHRAAEALALTA